MKLPYTVLRPATHDEWLALRKEGVGASSVGKLLGVSAYGNAYTLWRDTVGLGEPVTENWYMAIGHVVEPYIASRFTQDIGPTIIKSSAGDWLAVSKEYPFLRVSPDRIYWLRDEQGIEMKHTALNRGVLECKSHHNDALTIDTWRTIHADWFAQIQYQLHVLGLKEGYLGCLNVFTGELFFDRVAYNPGFCRDIIIPTVTSFWHDHIEPCRAIIQRIIDHKHNHGRYTEADIISHPRYAEEASRYAPPVTAAEDVPKRYPKPEEGKYVEAETLAAPYNYPEEEGADKPGFFESLGIYKRIKAQIKDLEAQCKVFEDYCKLSLMDAEQITDRQGNVLATYRCNKPSMKFDEKRYREEHAEEYSQYLIEKPGARVLKIK